MCPAKNYRKAERSHVIAIDSHDSASFLPQNWIWLSRFFSVMQILHDLHVPNASDESSSLSSASSSSVHLDPKWSCVGAALVMDLFTAFHVLSMVLVWAPESGSLKVIE